MSRLRRLRAIWCWFSYLCGDSVEPGGHIWVKVETILDKARLEAITAYDNQFTSLQLYPYSYIEVYQCRVCDKRKCMSGWNDMVCYIGDKNA